MGIDEYVVVLLFLWLAGWRKCLRVILNSVSQVFMDRCVLLWMYVFKKSVSEVFLYFICEIPTLFFPPCIETHGLTVSKNIYKRILPIWRENALFSLSLAGSSICQYRVFRSGSHCKGCQRRRLREGRIRLFLLCSRIVGNKRRTERYGHFASRAQLRPPKGFSKFVPRSTCSVYARIAFALLKKKRKTVTVALVGFRLRR